MERGVTCCLAFVLALRLFSSCVDKNATGCSLWFRDVRGGARRHVFEVPFEMNENGRATYSTTVPQSCQPDFKPHIISPMQPLAGTRDISCHKYRTGNIHKKQTPTDAGTTRSNRRSGCRSGEEKLALTPYLKKILTSTSHLQTQRPPCHG